MLLLAFLKGTVVVVSLVGALCGLCLIFRFRKRASLERDTADEAGLRTIFAGLLAAICLSTAVTGFLTPLGSTSPTWECRCWMLSIPGGPKNSFHQIMERAEENPKYYVDGGMHITHW